MIRRSPAVSSFYRYRLADERAFPLIETVEERKVFFHLPVNAGSVGIPSAVGTLDLDALSN